ncbi:Autophagy-related protein 13 [Penicillium cf. griseofulvum]|nr:Autophagy-related protein 13 [Penicillium cf. griseofulvum]
MRPQSWNYRCPIAFLITDSGSDNTQSTLPLQGAHHASTSPIIGGAISGAKLPPRPTARDDRREQQTAPSSPTVDMGSNSARGLGIEPGHQPSEQGRNAALGKEALTRLNQIISNYHTKAALIILHSRVELPPSFNKGSESPRVNRWFNVELDDTDILREPLRPWRTCDATDNRPPPLVIETYLDTKGLTNNQSLVILDENGKRWDVRESLTALEGARAKPYQSENDEIILERWRIELGESSSKPPADLGSILPTVYKKSIVLFRSLFTYSKFLPAWRFSKRNKKLRQSPALQIKYRVVDGSASRDDCSLDHLTAPLSEGSEKVVDTYSFGVTESPAGPFSVQVTYRTNCDFRVDDSEALLSSRFMGADDEIFRPSLPSDDVNRPNPEVGSVPVERRTVENPDCTRAYGSLSTFHQVGPTTGASPISALRAMRDSGAGSPSPTDSSKRLLPPAKVVPSGRAAQIAGEGGGPGFQRRPSISFQPFKAPPLSASPALADSPLGVSPRNMSSRIPTGTSADSRVMPPPSSAASARRPITAASEQAISFSNSASPKPAPISRYSSSFSHRRGRISAGANRLEDDNSSGRASATSSNAQPGSGLLTEATGTSAESIHADDENISDFLKMLDSKKDLMNSTTSASIQPGSKQPNTTAAALARFRSMRDSNAALSDSMSQSMLMHRSSISSSKQLSGVPLMVAGTSISTASSPGKPISPHTPHTPAIRSRLSSNSVADDIETDHPSRIPRIQHDSPLEEHPGMENARGPSSTAGAIDIPASPRIFDPTYRRSSSAALRRPIVTSEDDEIFPFGMRSLSLGADEPSNTTLGAAQQQNEFQKSQQSPAEDPSGPSGSVTGPYRDNTSLRGQMSRPASASASSNPHIYQPRFASSRGRGYSGGHSLSSASSSLARGANLAPHLAERDQDRDGNASGSNSGNSTSEIRRGSAQRPSTGRTLSAQAPEDDEPLLFAMSDFGVSRRSLDEGRHGNHGGAESAAGSRRGSGRRGAGLPGFHVWS